MELGVTCEWLLRRVVVEVDVNVHGGYGYWGRGEHDCKNDDKDENEGDNNNNGGGVRVMTKRCTVTMDAWAKSERRPTFWLGGGWGRWRSR